VRFSPRAKAQLAELRRYYRQKGRPEAARNLIAAMKMAAFKIGRGQSLPAPRPNPDLQAGGEAWVHVGHYWVLHTTGEPVTVLAVFYDTADIPVGK
jgi:plasmid stabilization system protein ParE